MPGQRPVSTPCGKPARLPQPGVLQAAQPSHVFHRRRRRGRQHVVPSGCVHAGALSRPRRLRRMQFSSIHVLAGVSGLAVFAPCRQEQPGCKARRRQGALARRRCDGVCLRHPEPEECAVLRQPGHRVGRQADKPRCDGGAGHRQHRPAAALCARCRCWNGCRA